MCNYYVQISNIFSAIKNMWICLICFLRWPGLVKWDEVRYNQQSPVSFWDTALIRQLHCTFTKLNLENNVWLRFSQVTPLSIRYCRNQLTRNWVLGGKKTILWQSGFLKKYCLSSRPSFWILSLKGCVVVMVPKWMTVRSWMDGAWSRLNLTQKLLELKMSKQMFSAISTR